MERIKSNERVLINIGQHWYYTTASRLSQVIHDTIKAALGPDQHELLFVYSFTTNSRYSLITDGKRLWHLRISDHRQAGYQGFNFDLRNTANFGELREMIRSCLASPNNTLRVGGLAYMLLLVKHAEVMEDVQHNVQIAVGDQVISLSLKRLSMLLDQLKQLKLITAEETGATAVTALGEGVIKRLTTPETLQLWHGDGSLDFSIRTILEVFATGLPKEEKLNMISPYNTAVAVGLKGKPHRFSIPGRLRGELKVGQIIAVRASYRQRALACITELTTVPKEEQLAVHMGWVSKHPPTEEEIAAYLAEKASQAEISD
ncbi:hypothetical protein KTT66_12775 [Lacticaseibacillus casei]|jgi:hypothetical protein|uniref:Uncharacterized protein n=1 Tax=Lacticaseibacillus huelsenbergensis TaxID=3035291 RepID=A0ABY8DUU8_9LACO|nr:MULTISPECIES: hypothetical protein [Lacticaseibacillus]MDG3061002.1 hypothetical protein [Lacticaseibacillus sp. BCRC 81376]QVI37224.1 hypothetical protein KGS74_13595 [Lacticaseibacillus casei]QXG59016.1 hypothetical protein KTT66_12775 [Lacticaseibacillus casei]WFB39537.1 hypothetical protein LHUE1_000263 [Lacticaseibacillus huelsenbergensis]WFB41239.1 hypothetical protein LHUE2_002045 [Lacticaseibacillus huelsenbergensis]